MHGGASKTKRPQKPSQCYDSRLRVLKVDLHCCSLLDAERIVPVKVKESHQAGLRAMLIIYGKSNQDLGTAVHKALNHISCAGCCYRKESVGIFSGIYSPVPNGSLEDVAVLVVLERNPSPRAVFITAFHAEYHGEVPGFSLSGAYPTCELDLAAGCLIDPPIPTPPKPPKPRNAPPSGEAKSKELRIPPEWLGKKNK